MEETISKDKTQFRIELFLALILTGLACAAGFSNLLFASNDLYPAATDCMGHMAKVQYIVRCLSEGVIPSWFPYWYSGATVSQYYPPLPYYVMAPIYAITKNIMLTFKIDCFLMMFIGGMGCWYFCQRTIGKWCGLIAIFFYCLQPFLLGSLYKAGVLAQGPIYALTPWFLYFILQCIGKPTRKRFLICTLITVLMILSHAMHTFMVAVSVMMILFIFIITKRVEPINYLIVALSIFFSGILTAFWSVVGVTGLENQAIPYILPGVAANVTATVEWFEPQYMGKFLFYFGLPISILAGLAILIFLIRASKKTITSMERFEIPFCIGLTLFTLVFSFGKQIPGFQYLPMSDSLVPGRILTLTAVTGAILGAYVFYLAISKVKIIRPFSAVILVAVMICIFTVSIYHINPYKMSFPMGSYLEFGKRFEQVNLNGSPFDKGRYTYYGGVSSEEANLPITYGLNIADGWNMEGTPHNRFLWNHLMCLSTGTSSYFAKNLAFWNVRYLEVQSDYRDMSIPLQQNLGFRKVYGNEFYASNLPSSYFLIDHRNALLFGAGSPGLAMEFPYLVHDQRNNIFDYSMEELERYRLIYLCEPEVDSLEEKVKTEETIIGLIDRGVMVLIEPADTKGYQLFDVAVSEVLLEDDPTIRKQNNSKIISEADQIKVDESMRFGRSMFGLDTVYYKLIQNGGRLENEIIGTKRAGNGEVLFIGKHLSQYLKAVYARNWGVPESKSGYPACSDEVKALFTDIFKTYGVNTDFWPEPFPVKKADWNYRGVDFEYSSRKAQEMTLSVTYTPRWKATLDGKPIEVGQKENLITLDLPAGDHEVKLVYGLTIYGIAGYIISLAGLLLFVFFIRYYGIITYRFRQIYKRFGRFLQLADRDENTEELDTGDIHAEKQENQQKQCNKI